MNYKPSEYALRVAWEIVQVLLFRPSPRQFWGWRSILLRAFGANVGADVRVWPTARIFAPWNLVVGSGTSIGDSAIVYNLGRITLGRRVTISQRAHLCAGTHDYESPGMPLVKLPIKIQDDVWVAAEAFVGPNTEVGARTIVAARAVVVRDFGPNVVVAGNPARVVKHRSVVGKEGHE